MTTLVAWAGTTAALAALDWAITREYLLDRHVVLCHVTAPSDTRPIPHSALDDLAAALQRDRTGIRFTAELLRGDPVEQLERRCQDGTLLVVGTDTRNEHPRRFERSLGMVLTRRGAIAVVIVPIDASHGAPGIVIGYNGSAAAVAALAFAADEADRRSEPLVIVQSWRFRPIEEDGADCPATRIDQKIDSLRLDIADVVASVRTEHPALAVDLRFAHGETVQSLLAAAGGTSLLVLGTDDPSRTSTHESTDHAVVMRMHTALAVIPPGFAELIAHDDSSLEVARSWQAPLP
ncbi:universal stress protein [Rathayibacter sp. SD072]|uniref:universal stress protein n=1 Tax=Rathayibacter sp. SD072 TaxID=2781731 RepID=UPI001A9732DC|nr:universal stress protein [Rathayibacter sp. SD072]MBO0983800.1 universal stress protein [Rathayibacter sp. SD072]